VMLFCSSMVKIVICFSFECRALRGHHITHSEALERQDNCAANRCWRRTGDEGPVSNGKGLARQAKADHSREVVLSSGVPAPARSIEPLGTIFQWSAPLRAWAVARCNDGTVTAAPPRLRILRETSAGRTDAYAASFCRSRASSSKLRPSPSSTADLPLSACQRCTATSTYFGSSSRP
jgi:hypothetical protein